MAERPVYAVRWFVPGSPPSFEAWVKALGREGLEVRGESVTGQGLGFSAVLEWVENDGTFGDAFSYGTVTPAGQRTIAAAGSALVLHVPVYLAASRTPMALLLSKLARAGGLAARLEQSKLGWTISRWVEVLEGDDPSALYRCAVVVLTDAGGRGLRSAFRRSILIVEWRKSAHRQQRRGQESLAAGASASS